MAFYIVPKFPRHLTTSFAAFISQASIWPWSLNIDIITVYSTSTTMAFDNALGADYKGSFQDTGVSDNDFVTAMASNGFQDFLGKSLSRTDLGHMFNTEQHVGQCPSTINPTDLQRDNFHVDPIEEEVLRRLRVDASSSPNNLRAIESQPRRELQPDGQVQPTHQQYFS